MINSLEEVLELDTQSMKAADLKSLLVKIKQEIKKKSKEAEEKNFTTKDLIYEAVSVVGNKLVKLKFNLDTKDAVVYDTEVDSRDIRGRNYMAGYNAMEMLKVFITKQK